MRWVVNAAGAWVGELGKAAGALDIPFKPRRRTLVTCAAPPGVDVHNWPLVEHAGLEVYFAPESGGVKLSPMDAEPMSPCDARPDEESVALAIHKLSLIAPALRPAVIARKWAGLRTFAPDELPVVGPDPRLPGFFWVAGQGGIGIETSSAIGQIAADLIATGSTDLYDFVLLSPTRFV